jgi:hypothetical protein
MLEESGAVGARTVFEMESGEIEVRSPLELVRLLPSYARHPVVADANVFFQDSRRYAETGFTILTFLARHEVITLLTCEHVADRLPELILERAIDPRAQLRVWRETYLPLIRFVRVPDSMCAGHPQVEAIIDPEDRPFARLAIATAPGLLLTRDHHFTDVGLGTEEWADALKLVGDLVELDAAVYGGAHTALMLSRVAGLLTQWAWRMAVANPLISLAAAGLGLLLFLENTPEAIRRARSMYSAIKDSGGRLLEAGTPMLERREAAQGQLRSRLEQPAIPRSVESICAHHIASRRLPVTSDTLLDACARAGIEMPTPRLVSFMRAHPSFTATTGAWELGTLGLPVVEADDTLPHDQR